MYTVSLSVSDVSAIAQGKVKFLPVGFSLDAYKVVLRDNRIMRAYMYTILYAGLGTFFFLLFTSMLAYSLSIRHFCFRKTITVLLMITMFVSGGLIPYYLTVIHYRLDNTIWPLVLPGSISAFYVIIFRTFFQEISPSLRESATIDGANDFYVLWKIILPLSKPLLATMSLFMIVDGWNSYMGALLFLRDSNKYPLQMLLREVMILFTYDDLSRQNVEAFKINQFAMQSAMVVVTMLPIMCVYPFLQKYFVKGIMIGAVKG
jgi:putative aldouronate transport system permease protein